MAPRTKLSQLPSCDQVIYNPTTRKFEAPDVVVRAITREAGVDETRTVNSRSEEHTSELQSLMRISYAVFCLNKIIHPYYYTTPSYTIDTLLVSYPHNSPQLHTPHTYTAFY